MALRMLNSVACVINNIQRCQKIHPFLEEVTFVSSMQFFFLVRLSLGKSVFLQAGRQGLGEEREAHPACKS